MEKLSVLVIVRNEEKNIVRCLESVKWADEIVIIDQVSIDKTIEIAKKYTGKIFITALKGDCERDRMLGISKATSDWVLLLDADEVVPAELKEEIQTILKNPGGFTSFYLGRKNFFLGQWIKGGGWYPAYSIKLFRKGFAYFPLRIHHDGLPQGGKAGYLKEKSLHYTYESLYQYFEKLNRYTSVLAEESFQAGERVGLGNFTSLFILKPFFYFLKKYLLMLGFRDGARGLFIAFSSGLTIFFHYAKLLELQKNARAENKFDNGRNLTG